MKKKILIIGLKSFIGSNLFKYFISKKNKATMTSFENFLKNFKSFDCRFDFIINCSSNKKFIKNIYNVKNDHDLIIANKIKNSNTNLVTLSTRKIYKPKFNIKESDKKNPNCNYSKNKLKSEISIKKILNNRSLILRISNLIGSPINNSRKLHKTFLDFFFETIKQGYIYENKKIYKDFISINKFNEIVYQLIKKNSYGAFNVSIGKKVYLNKIITWLNFYNSNKTIVIRTKKSFNKDSFTLNNRKLMNKIKIKNDLYNLKKKCLLISKNFFIHQ
ncbi:sugar nucleotide-binding protein [Candidatus Pelagibacter sp.]|nr:sugar nucleotide-binding protein [Candidatus Pelagibacter sp.]